MSETNTIHWEISQLVKTKLFPDEHAVLRSALRALFQSRPEIKRQMVIRAYTAGEISLGKAAEIMGFSHEEMMVTKPQRPPLPRSRIGGHQMCLFKMGK